MLCIEGVGSMVLISNYVCTIPNARQYEYYYKLTLKN